MNPSRLPNAISAFRLLSAPMLLAMAVAQMHQAFAWLLIPAFASDILDGWLARKLHCESPFGAQLDSLADISLMGAVIVSIWFLHPAVYRQHWPIIAAVLVVWTIAHLLALLRYGRPASFHTRLIQAGILLFGVFAVVLFTYDFVAWMLYLAGIVSLLGAAEHLVLLALLPAWTPDIRGGLRQVLRERRNRAP